MTTRTFPEFTPDQSAAEVDAALRQALSACDGARKCADLWSAEVQRRGLDQGATGDAGGDAAAQLSPASAPAAPPAAPALTTIILSNDVRKIAHFEALVEIVHTLGLVAADADQMDVVLFALESWVSTPAPPAH